MFPRPNFTPTPNDFFDDIAKTLKEGELRVLLVIMRQTFGWGKTWDRISLSQMETKTGMERKAVVNSLKSLIEKHLVKKHKEGKNGEEKCWYTLIVEAPEKEAEIPGEFSESIDDSNNFDQYPKDTPPSILKIPTKETLTKERKKEKVKKERTPSPSALAIKNRLLEKIREINPEFSGDVGKWEEEIERLLLKKASEEKILELIDWIFDDDFWKGVIISPRGLSKHFEKITIQKLTKKTSSAFKANSPTHISESVLKQNLSLIEKVVEKFPDMIRSMKINTGSNYIEFVYGQTSTVLTIGQHGFRDQILKNLERMNLPRAGL